VRVRGEHMIGHAIVDTGVLVAVLDAEDRHHKWAMDLLHTLRGPWLTAEACITESLHLLGRFGAEAVHVLFGWLEQHFLRSRHFLPEELGPVRAEMVNNRWVDFADACIVTLSDCAPKLPVVTVDARDFAIYFRHRRDRTLVLPPSRN
jgi:uncharacterized protein